MAKAMVLKEHTLGLLRGNTLEVLNGLASRGGKHHSDSPIAVFEEELRPATLEDFEVFQVRYHPDYELESV